MRKYTYSDKSVSNVIFIFIATVIVLGLIILAGMGITAAYHHEPTTFTVKDKAVVVTDKRSTYLVYTDVETYSIEDSYVWRRFDSSDWYGRVQVGRTYRCTVQGWRVPYLSWYQNIVRMEDITAPEVPRKDQHVR